MNLNATEARLIAIRRAIARLDRSDLVEVADASPIDAYLGSLLDMSGLEESFTANDIEKYLDGVIAGLAIHRAISMEIPYSAISRSAQDNEKQFQTGIDPKTNLPHTH